MLEVIIPLAERTNALVIISGLQHCALSSAFTRMLKLRKSKYPGGNPPFSVLAFVEAFCAVVANPSEDAHWRTILSGSKKWKKRHKFLKSGVRQHVDGQRLTLTLTLTLTQTQTITITLTLTGSITGCRGRRNNSGKIAPNARRVLTTNKSGDFGKRR